MFKLSTLLPASVVFLAVAHGRAGESTGPVQWPQTVRLPAIGGAPAERSTPFIAWPADRLPRDWVEQEYTLSGRAAVYGYVDESSGSPTVRKLRQSLPYTTRLLVRRPVSPADFSGTVYLEVLNATAGWDGDPIWQSTHEFMLREGSVWVGITLKPVTVRFLREGWGAFEGIRRNAGRYETLSMPRFGQAWDMLAQLGVLLGSTGSEANPLRDLGVERLIMVGYSQSADYLVTFANSFHQLVTGADGLPAYDGYYVSAGRESAKHVTGEGPGVPEELLSGDPRNLVEVNAPVIRFQTQTEVIVFDAHRVRQSEPEYPMLRFYEMAGGAHVDAHLDGIGGLALARDLGLPPSFCPEPVRGYNPIRIGYVQAALLKALERWIETGTAPPASRFLQLGTGNSGPGLLRDADGNALGGLRPPQLEVPLGVYSESNSGPGFCGLYGGFEPFEAGHLRSLYQGPKDFEQQIKRAIDRSIKQGFLLPTDSAALQMAATAEARSALAGASATTGTQ